MNVRKKTKLCKNCGKEFQKVNLYSWKYFETQKFCTKKCANEWKKENPNHYKKSGFQNGNKYGVNRNRGGYIDKMGYKCICVDGKEIREHRAIAEKILKRKLSFDEIVHHKNGKKDDNRKENLEIMSRAKHQSLHHKGKPKKRN